MKRWIAVLLALSLLLLMLNGCKGKEKNTQKEEPLSNLFEMGEEGFGISPTGEKRELFGYVLSQWIEAEEGDQFFFGPVAPSQGVFGYCYNEEGAPLSLINPQTMKEEAAFPDGFKIYSYLAPEGSGKIQIAVDQDLADYMVVTRNHSLTLAEHEQLSEVPQDFFGDCLYGKEGLFVGDSICAGPGGGWAYRIGFSTGMNATNNGVGGASLSTCREEWIVNQLLRSKDEEFDYVLIHGGVNDAWESAPVGEMSESFNPDDFDTSTYAGGLEWVIYTAISHFGDMGAIGYLINYQMPAAPIGCLADMSAYVAMGKKICEKWGISYFDMYYHEEINQELDLTTTKHTDDTKNYVHVNDSGYDVIFPYIEEYMRGMTACPEEILTEVFK